MSDYSDPKTPFASEVSKDWRIEKLEIERDGFGLVHLKKEGAAAHPDGYTYRDGSEVSDEWYLRQLKAYAEWNGVENTKQEMCERPHLLEKL